MRHRAQSECENIWTASKADVSSRYATAGKRMTTLPSHLFGGILGSVLESRNWLVCSQRSRVLCADSGCAVGFFAGWVVRGGGLISRFKNLWSVGSSPDPNAAKIPLKPSLKTRVVHHVSNTHFLELSGFISHLYLRIYIL